MVMVFNSSFNNSGILLFKRGGQIDWWRKQEDPEKITDLSQVTYKFIT